MVYDTHFNYSIETGNFDALKCYDQIEVDL